MHARGRAVSPPLRRSRWATRLAMGAGTSLAAVALVGTMGAVPAAAQGLSAEPVPTFASTGLEALYTTAPEPGRDKDRDRDKDKDKDRPDDGDGDGCFEIDTVRQEAAGGGAFYAATSGGIAYVGDELTPLGTIDWDDLSDEGGDVPEGACGVSIDVGPTDGNDIVIDVITTAGTVHTIVCERTGSVIDECGTWEERDAPTPGATSFP
ncbi:hypothetical protein QFZ82_006172 [Streptomyces sp. V4I23]|uniref:hypothetical protein n=1 Tax=Streptomyces sp. V4I23 TaxID=3042282 RepID=UPI002786905A|nr:hypothetical protein [Streptomyces sp. V4I23]MDQ1011687.1 hypothetical protein [Streptomyces sp. V4I23]